MYQSSYWKQVLKVLVLCLVIVVAVVFVWRSYSSEARVRINNYDVKYVEERGR